MIGAAIKKDVVLLVRDRGALISLFLLPVVFMIAFGSMFQVGGRSAPRDVPIWYAPGDARGEAIAKLVAGTDGFVAARVAEADEVRRRVASQRDGAGLVVPATGPVELVIDLAAPAQARAPIQGALTGIVMRASAPVALDALPPFIEPRSPPGLAHPLAHITPFQVTVPGNAVLFGFFIALTTAMSFVAERRMGTWRRLLAAPVPRWKALLATLVPYYVVGVGQMTFLFGVGILAFGMQIAGSPVALVVLSLTVTLCAVCLGLVFAAFATSEKQLGGVGSVVLLIMGMLGGCMFPRLQMPPTMRSLGHAVPHSWALDAYYDVLVRAGTSVADIAPTLGILLAFAAGFATLGLWRFRFER
jgi:ABC-2 type transport system permease protein